MQNWYIHNRPQEMDMKSIYLRSGIGISLWSCHFNRSFCHQTAINQPMFGIGYVLKGSAQCSINNHTIEFKQYHPHIQFMGDIVSNTDYHKDEEFQYLYLWMKPELFERYLLDAGSRKAYSFQNFLGNQAFSIQQAEIEIAEKNSLCELYSQLSQFSKTKNLILLESRCLDLVSFNLQRILGTVSNINKSKEPNAYICQQLELAKNILISRLDNPPSLLELANMVGINDCTLKKGFKMQYGDTVYGFLRQKRLEKAYELIVYENLNVSESAYAVGYSNLSHFSHSF